MYKLVNGQKVEYLIFHHEKNTPWGQSQFYYDEETGKLIAQQYNSETGEIQTVDAMGRII